MTGIFTFGAPAQEEKDKKSPERPNFSGTWVIDKEKSYTNAETRRSVADYTIVIAHNGDEMKISRNYTIKNNKSSYTEIFYLDKRKEKNVDKTGITNEPEIKSETFWKKQTVVRRFLYSRSGGGMPAYIPALEKYSLSKDGKVLTITTEFNLSSFGSDERRVSAPSDDGMNRQTRLIFNRQD